MLSKDDSISRLKKQISLIPGLKTKYEGSGFDKWKRDTEVLIARVFDEKSRHLKDFTRIRYGLMMYHLDTPKSEHHRAFCSGLDSARAVLESMVDEIKEFHEDTILKTCDENEIQIITRICKRFHLVARQLKTRHGNRATLEIIDEYDVQDLMYALLKLHFEDIRCEEGTPSHAGSNSRMDFLLKDHNLVLEIKHTRQGLGAKKLGEELIIDMKRYSCHPDCKTLFCFVYDPKNYLENPRGLEKDLSSNENGFQVITIICPH